MIFRHEFGKGEWNLPEILNYEEYRYNKSCACDNCNYYFTHPTAYREGIVGYCVTENGYFLCFECPGCGSKYSITIRVTEKNMEILRNGKRCSPCSGRRTARV